MLSDQAVVIPCQGHPAEQVGQALLIQKETFVPSTTEHRAQSAERNT